MKIVSYTKNPISELLVKDIKGKGFDLLKADEKSNYKYLENNNVQISLLNPIQYAEMSKSVDIRIIPHSCVSLEGMTGLIGIDLHNQNTSTFINKTTISYLDKIFQIIIKEKYKIDVEKESKDPDFILKFDSNETSFDLTEDWKDLFNISLPIYFWCVRYDDSQYDLNELNQILDQITERKNKSYTHNDGFRTGKIILNWENIIEKDIDETLEILFYQNITSELFSSKLYD